MIKHFAKKVDYKIPADLRGLVAAVITGESANEINLEVPIFATGFPLLVNICGNKPTYIVNDRKLVTKSRLVIAGQIYKARIHFKQTGLFKNLGIILMPSAPYYLFHKPGKFFNNEWTNFEDSSPNDSKFLIEQLAICTSNQDRIQLIMNFLIELNNSRLPEIDWLENSINKILKKNGQVGQDELTDTASMSDRHFRRVFKNIVGVPPKYFCKVIQLNTVFQLLNVSASEKIHHLALDCGYFDQNHFIKDFYSLIGETPERFLNGELSFLKEYMGRYKT